MPTTWSGACLHLRITGARHRRVIIAVLAALAVASALSALRPAARSTVRVPVAARDLPAGHRLVLSDLSPVSWLEEMAPAGIVLRPQGRVLSGPLRRGEPVTDVRLRPATTGEAAGLAGRGATGRGGKGATGRVAVTVRLTDPAAAVLAAPGDHVQLIAGPSSAPGPQGLIPSGAQVVVRDALVLEVAAASGGGSPAITEGSPAPDPRHPVTGDNGLLDIVGPSPLRDDEARGAHGLPVGVLAVAVRPADALGLAAASGTRSLTVARPLEAEDPPS
jgi:pilus assembly protein CpaB